MYAKKILNEQKQLSAVLIGNTEEDKKKEEKKGYIAMIVVCGSQRGKGLGKILVNRFIKDLTAKGYNKIVLETECVNKGALALYESILIRPWFLQNKIIQKLLLKWK